MALSANSVWEVRTAGLDTNGGGFVTGAAGTDYSLQDAKNTVGNNISTTDAVAVGTGVITSVTATFTSAIVGNIIYLQGGTGVLAAGWYQVTVFTSSTSITVDRNVAAGTGITMNIGGALLTIQVAVDNMAAATSAADQLAWVKSGTYNLTAAITTTTPTAVLRRNRVYGYAATRGDYPTGSTRPTIKTNGNAIDAVILTSDWHFANFIIDGSGAAVGQTGLNVSENFTRVENVKVATFEVQGIRFGGISCVLSRCEVTGVTANAAIRIDANGCIVINCWAHDNTVNGIAVTANRQGVTVLGCISSDNTGGTTDGINVASGTNAITLRNNVSYGNGRDGIRWATLNDVGCQIYNNVMVSNGGFGLNASAATFPAESALAFDYNAFGNNTAGARSVIGAGPHDATLSTDPFTNAAADDFSLNITAGGGAALRAAGFPGVFPGGLTTGYLDIGAVQHADPVAGGQSISIFGG